MARGGQIGSLFVSLGAQTAEFDAGLAQASARAQRFTGQLQRDIGRDLVGTFGRLRGAIAGVVAAMGVREIAGWANRVAQAGEDAVNLSAALGITLEQFVRLQGAMTLTEGTMEDASRTMLRLAQSVSEAMESPASRAGEAFAQLGISQDELRANAHNLEGMLKLLADAFVRFENTPVKSAAFMDLMGRSMQRLVPLLSGGAAGIEEAKRRADELDPSALAAARAANTLSTATDELDKAFQGLANEGFRVLEPRFTDAANNLTEMISLARGAVAEIGRMESAVVALGNTLARSLASAMQSAPQLSLWRMLNSWLGIPGLRPQAIAAAPIPPAPAGGGDNTPPPTKLRVAASGASRARGAGRGDADRQAREAERLAAELQRQQIRRIEGEERLSDAQFDRQRRRIAQMAALEKITAEQSVQLERDLVAQRWAADEAYFKRKLAAAAQDAEDQEELQREFLVRHEQFLAERERLDFESARIQFDRTREMMMDIGQTLESSFGRIFDAVLDGSFRLRDAIGDLLRDLGRLMVNRAFQALLFGGSGGSGGGLLGSIFGALGIGGSKPSDNFQHFASGGSFEVGGAGAIDSQLVAFRATPGEMVNVSHGNDAGAAGDVVRIELNPSEGWVAGVADQQIRTRSGQIIQVAVRQSYGAVRRDLGGMMPEAEARAL